MNGWQMVTQEILQILSNPAWSGVSSISALIGIPLAIYLARKSKPALLIPYQVPRYSKKNRITLLTTTYHNDNFE